MQKKDITVKLGGLAPIMFDKFYDQTKIERKAEDKLYLKDGIVVLPTANLWAFLTCQRTGCVRIFPGKGWMDYYRSVQSFVRILEADPLPLLDDKDKPIKFDDFKDKVYVHTANVIVGTGKNISRVTIHRPALRLPWYLSFHLVVFQNDLTPVSLLAQWFVTGGLLIGLGNGRPNFGRFEVVQWDVK